ncbi:hypothetical protein PG995_009673 [Apiospora arundinis]
MAADGFPVQAEEVAWQGQDAADRPLQANGDSSSNGEPMPPSQAFTDRSAAGAIAAAQQAIKQRGETGIASRSKSVASDYRSTSRSRPQSSMAQYDTGDSESSLQDTTTRMREARLRASKDLPRVENGLIRIPRRNSSVVMERPRSVMSQRRPSDYSSSDLQPRNEYETRPTPVANPSCSGESGSESTKAPYETYIAALPGVSNSKTVRGEDLERDSRPDRSMSSTPVGLVRLDDDTVSQYENRRRNSYSSISSRISVPASYTSTIKRPKTSSQSRPSSMMGSFSRYDTNSRHQSPRRNPSVHVLPYVDEHGDWVEFDGEAQAAVNGGGSIMSGMSGISRRPSVTVRKPPSQHGSLSSGGSSRLPDFFSQQVFQVVLHNPATAHHLLKFSENRVCSENVEFFGEGRRTQTNLPEAAKYGPANKVQIEQYHTTLNQLADIMTGIHKTYMTHQSPHQLNVPGKLLKEVHKRMKSIVMTKLPAMEALFTEMEVLVEQLVFTDIYPRFVNHQLTLNASKALVNDRSKFQGLGDCFCLTSPSLADNPVVFASDGLIKVTGYSRTEIISRNCRFLQGKLTDPVPVRRLRNAMMEGREAVELLLNYKKNGDPFWNLLYIAPLIDENGEVAFWLGGQINCSSTIHNSADVMRVLSTSKSDGNEQSQVNQNQMQPRTSFSKTLLRALGLRNDNPNPLKSVASFDVGTAGGGGMEQDVLGRMEGQDLPSQIKEFYTTYSKYIVVRADSFVINFYSQGVADVLHPLGHGSNSSNSYNSSTLTLDKNNSNNSNGSNGARRTSSHDSKMVGSDVFKFLKSCMIGPSAVNAAGDYKNRVRSCVRGGHPVSVDLRLQTRRSAKFRGDEAFVVHWTPLKDERAVAHWVIVTLVPTIP